MAAPVLFELTAAYGKTAVLAVTTSATAIVSNSAASGTVVKINTLIISNIDGSNNADISIDLYRSSTAYYIAKTVTVPADSSLDVMNKPIYLEEGDSLRLTASADSDLQGICSYEVLS